MSSLRSWQVLTFAPSQGARRLAVPVARRGARRREGVGAHVIFTWFFWKVEWLLDDSYYKIETLKRNVHAGYTSSVTVSA